MTVAILGAGAFGTSLALALARSGQSVALWGHDSGVIASMRRDRLSGPRLPGFELPATLEPVDTIPTSATAYLLAVPMQQARRFLEANRAVLHGKTVVATCKGLDLETGQTPIELIKAVGAKPAMLSGPSFAIDIAKGLPTALSLAADDPGEGKKLQDLLSTETLRLYRTDDCTGVALGGALKNVVALGAGMVMGAEIGESARAALITRGYAEMVRLAMKLGAQPTTLAGLSGFGDLVLTCTSEKSRNFCYGRAMGAGSALPVGTTEGVATAKAVSIMAKQHDVDMPIANAVALVLDKKLSIREAMDKLLSRPLKEE